MSRGKLPRLCLCKHAKDHKIILVKSHCHRGLTKQFPCLCCWPLVLKPHSLWFIALTFQHREQAWDTQIIHLFYVKNRMRPGCLSHRPVFSSLLPPSASILAVLLLHPSSCFLLAQSSPAMASILGCMQNHS